MEPVSACLIGVACRYGGSFSGGLVMGEALRWAAAGMSGG
jgi:uncharacterized protein YbbK (DUF523 family)